MENLLNVTKMFEVKPEDDSKRQQIGQLSK